MARGDLPEEDRMRRHPEHENSQHETEIAHAIGQESFRGRLRRRLAIEPMADQDIGSEPDQFPEDEKHDEIVRQDDSDHGEHKQRQGREITGSTFFVSHVAD